MWHDTRGITHTVRTPGGATLMAIFGGGSGVDGVRLTDGSAVSAAS